MRIITALLLVLFLTSNASADIGFFGSYVEVTNNGSASFYDLTPAGAGHSNPFEGANLGTFTGGVDTLTISDVEGLTFKNGGGDVTGVKFNYSVVASGGGHSFTEQNVGFTANATFTDSAGGTFSGSGDQQWSDASAWAPVDLLSGLSDGNYELQVFMRGTGNAADFFHSNGGANYTADFTVSVPEPITLLTFGGSLAILGLRRRRKSSN